MVYCQFLVYQDVFLDDNDMCQVRPRTVLVTLTALRPYGPRRGTAGEPESRRLAQINHNLVVRKWKENGASFLDGQ